MTRIEGKSASAAVKDILPSGPEGLSQVIRAVMQGILETGMDEAPGARKDERTPERLGRAFAAETNENWMEASLYIDMDDLRGHKKRELRKAA